MPYQGRQPGVGVRDRFIFTATTGQTSFSGNDSNGLPLKYDDATYVDVFINGTLLVPVTDYTATTKTSVVLIDAAAANDVLEILAYGISSIADTVSASSGGTFAADVTFAGDAIFGDNDKAIFGAGSDLQIYHDATNSYIDSNTGRLYVTAASSIRLTNSDNTENYARFNEDGSVQLYHNNVEKLATTSTGIDVTGVLSVSDGSAGAPSITNTGDVNTGIFFPAADKIALSAGGTQRLTMAADGKVGLGTDDPTSFNAAANQFVISAGGDTGLTIDSTSSTSSSIHFADGPTGTEAYRGYISYSHGNDRMNIGASATDVLRLQSGNVDIVNGNLIVANGHGIDFSAQTTAGGTVQEVLNHYEQGAFTPTLIDTGGEEVNAYVNQAGFYVRVGARVTCHGYIRANGLASASGNMLLGGFPFDAVNVTNGHASMDVGYGTGLNITAGQNMGGYLGPNTTQATVLIWNAATGTANMTFSDLSSNGGFMFAVSYNVV